MKRSAMSLSSTTRMWLASASASASTTRSTSHRHDHEQIPDPITTLRTSGSAVFVCSLTTIIGYGSLLVSDNLAIRGFGTASLIGEVACVFTALVVVPAMLAVGRHRPVDKAEPRAA